MISARFAQLVRIGVRRADRILMQIGRLVGGGVAGLGLVGAGSLGLAGEDNTTRDETGAVVDGGEVGAFRVRLGDCLQDATDGDFDHREVLCLISN